ncbi:hypothetical protein [Hyphomicrobium sp.]|nr:hypothetical protein [Hyphomicrobium sp.]MBY0558897.1 hypothetical protein [Hyphomicrobium sp.]
MSKHAGKIRFDEVNDQGSDGYHVFITLLCVVAATTLAGIISLALEMLG